jgi:hypothetical protein
MSDKEGIDTFDITIGLAYRVPFNGSIYVFQSTSMHLSKKRVRLQTAIADIRYSSW